MQWETDEYAVSIVYYGVGYLPPVKSDQSLVLRHPQVLLGLESDKVYQYQIVSRDLFDNETKSPVMEFSTAKSFWSQGADCRANDPFASDIDLSWQLSQIGNECLLVIKADRPVTVSLGVEIKEAR